MPGRVRRMTSSEVDRMLRRHGFEQVGRSGSHVKYRHPASRLQAVVPAHAGRVLPVGTIVAIFTGANIPRAERTD